MAEDLQTGLVGAETDANGKFSTAPVGGAVQACPYAQSHWIDIQLLDGAEPAAGERYTLTLPGGRTEKGALDSRGRVRLENVQKPGACTIVFPDIDAGAASGDGGDDAHDPPDPPAIRYVPGQTPMSVQTDAAWVYQLPDWDLVEIDAKEDASGVGAGSGGDGAADDEPAEEEDDWDVVEILHADDE